MDISIATEDILTEEAMIKIIASKERFRIRCSLGKKGCGYLTSNLDKFNALANSHHVLLVLDLDNKHDLQEFKNNIEGQIRNKDEKLKIIVPVREIESWLLADREGLSKFLAVSKDKIDREPELLLDPKEKIINLARQSRDSNIKKGIPPKQGAAAKMGLSYNTLLCSFIREHWDITRAFELSPSLRETISFIDDIQHV
ncbi:MULTISPECIES: DUF4276 family protein [Enterobacter cloacae complex]|uniref:DUF4276 family protein n=1 Tax=Enterobacter cloacae complex TaxID=354276 RepID=UPI0007E51ECB|nr:DUF4276 family protein [Enterobacter asburiae]OAY19441.1 hypothetical protein AXY04_00550 [Enterobacter asburiae]